MWEIGRGSGVEMVAVGVETRQWHVSTQYAVCQASTENAHPDRSEMGVAWVAMLLHGASLWRVRVTPHS